MASIGYANSEVIDVMVKKYESGGHYLASTFGKDVDVENLQNFLCRTTNGAMCKVFLTGSGSDAIEAAIKVAYQAYVDQDPDTPRKYIIARENSYHGNTLTTLTLSDFLSRKEPYKNILGDNVEHVSSCDAYTQRLEGESDEEFVARKADELDKIILKIGPEKVIGFILEPYSGAAIACAPPVPGYLQAMKEVCHELGVYFIADEIMCGLGRTGDYHVCLAHGVTPDILVIGKGLGSGYYPCSAVLITPDVCKNLKSEMFIHGLTFDANPAGAAAALKVQQIVYDTDLLSNVQKQGDYLGKLLKTKLSDHPHVGDIRGKGLF